MARRGGNKPSAPTSSREPSPPSQTPSTDHSESDNDSTPSYQIKRRARSPTPIDNNPDQFAFYDKSRKPTIHVCPFSVAGRDNPCTTYNKATKRRDRIRNHLIDIKYDGGDEHHPLEDPLWASWTVRYYLLKRPKKFNPEVKVDRARKKNKVDYANRVKKVNTKGPEMVAKYKAGEVTDKEMAGFLVGAPRAQFKMRVEMRERVEARIKALQEQPATVGNANEIAQLEDVRRELESTKVARTKVRQTLIQVTRELIGFWEGTDEEEKLLTDDKAFHPLGAVRGWDWDAWPSSPSVESYYTILAFLLPVDHEDDPWSDESMRLGKAAVRRYETSQKKAIPSFQLDPEAAQNRQQGLVDLVQTFNASCDLLKEEHQGDLMYTGMESKEWIEKQKKLWEEALARAEDASEANYYGKSPLEIMQIVDAVSRCWGAHKAALEREQVAENRAGRLLGQ